MKPIVLAIKRPFLLKSLVFSILQRLVLVIGLPNNFSNSLIGLLGSKHLFLVTTSLIFLLKKQQYTGHWCLTATLLFTALCQLYFDATEFTSFRGSLMIASMKQISFAYDTQKMTSANHQSLKESLCSMISSLKYLAIAIFFVTYSSCLAEEMPHLLGFPMLHKYTTAQSYRTSHYFVSYFAMFTAYISGFGDAAETTKWSKVEWPSSMSDVVVYWNMPMHRFLHKYIFQKTRFNFGYATAMFSTFLASSLLHGFNFLLTAVLLSLGFYAYAESAFRNGLSNKLNACLKSRKCVPDCQHRFKKNEFWVAALNLAFVFLKHFSSGLFGSSFPTNRCPRIRL
uniref:Protein-serine O-palmitoleoyltransferase porcupine n=1 Tax=Ditylenchus dipsaci TaxID=166011 RepID=A0A915D736_9BILA